MHNIGPNKGKIMTESEFESRIKDGEKLWILDDLVLDLSEYAKYHPGGKFIIDRTVGRDITKFFYGSYTLDGNTSIPGSKNERCVHSNMARKIVNGLIVANLERSCNNFMAQIDDS